MPQKSFCFQNDAGLALWSDPTGLQVAKMFGLWDVEEGRCLPGVVVVNRLGDYLDYLDYLVVNRLGELVHIVSTSIDFSELAEDTLRLVTSLSNADLSERMPQRSKPEEKSQNSSIPSQEVPKVEVDFKTKVTDWTLNKVNPVEKNITERPQAPRMVYCPR